MRIEHKTWKDGTQFKVCEGIWFNQDTPDDVIYTLVVASDNYQKYDTQRVRLFYGDQATGQDWGEEWETMGYIGLSNGQRCIPILVNNRRSVGGGSISTENIVKIVDTGNGYTLYEHPTYNAGNYEARPADPNDPLLKGDPDYQWSVDRDGDNVANFKTEQQARRYVDFMTGKRNSK